MRFRPKGAACSLLPGSAFVSSHLTQNMLGTLPIRTYMDGIQYLHSCFTSINFVEHLVDFAVRPFPDRLDDFPGVSGIWKVVKDNRFP